MIVTTLTRRSLLKGAAAVTAATLLPLLALAAAPDVVVDDVTVSTIASIEESPTVDLERLTDEEWETAVLICVFYGAGLSDDAIAATLHRYRGLEDVDVEDALALHRSCDREAIVGRRFGELPPERQAAGLLLGLGIIRALPVETFAKAHAMAMETAV
jgi:hypothetical protein